MGSDQQHASSIGNQIEVRPPTPRAGEIELEPASMPSFADGIRVPLPKLTSQRLVGGIVVCALTLLYMSLWWNRFLGGGSDGVLMVIGQKLLRGETPYRDFFMVIPPVMALKFAAMIRIFGSSIRAIRAVGVFDRVLLSLFVYIWITRLFSTKSAAIGSILSIIIFSGDIADVVEYYPADVAIWSLAAAYCAANVIDSAYMNRRLGWAILSGALAAIAALTKQSTGLGVLVLLPAVSGVLVFRFYGLRSALKTFAGFGIGSAVPIALAATWLARIGALSAFLDQVFKEGASSKGSLAAALLRPVVQPLGRGKCEAIIAALVLLIAWLFWRYGVKSTAEYQGPIAFHAIAGLCIFIAGMALIVILGTHIGFSARTPQLVVAMISLYGSGAVSVYSMFRCFKRSFNKRDAQLLLLSSFSFVTAYLVGMSWTPYEPMALPGIGMLICLAMSRGCSRSETWRPVACGLVVAAFAVIFFAVSFKLFLPFKWTTWSDRPVFFATKTSQLAALKGIHLPADTVDSVERITDLITSYSRPEDRIFVFPYLPLFFVLSARMPALFAIVHWFDVAPDRLCREEAGRLLQTRPRIVVYQEISSSMLLDNEIEFRAGRPSGQRDLINAIKELTKTYRLVGSVKPWGGNPINVFVRDVR